MISTLNEVTLDNGKSVKVSKLKTSNKILSYNFYSDTVVKDTVDTIEDDIIKPDDKIYEIKIKNNLGIIHTLRLKNTVLFNVNTKVWKNNEKVRQNFCSNLSLNSASLIKDMLGHQCILVSLKEVEKLPNERFVIIHPKFNKCIFINELSISCFKPRR